MFDDLGERGVNEERALVALEQMQPGAVGHLLGTGDNGVESHVVALGCDAGVGVGDVVVLGAKQGV